jgi:uncharacterized membrane protein
MQFVQAMRPLDIAALVIFTIAWIAYEPVLKAASRGEHINTDMTVVRRAWMKNMAMRDNRFIDSQLLGHALNSASFFASSNLILIAATASALFGGEAAFRSASSLIVISTSSRLLFEGQLALVLVTLVRSLLAFIWAIRQMNYCLAAVGAAPPAGEARFDVAYGEAAARVLNPALSSFNAGVRGYYFALAAAAWLFGAQAFIVTTLGALTLLAWRQRRSNASRGVADLRRLLEGHGQSRATSTGPAQDPPSGSG